MSGKAVANLAIFVGLVIVIVTVGVWLGWQAGAILFGILLILIGLSALGKIYRDEQIEKVQKKRDEQRRNFVSADGRDSINNN